MRVDFYQLTRDDAAQALAAIAPRALDAGQRMLVVSLAEDQREQIARALWSAGGFLANAEAASDHAARQPILLAADLDLPAVNGARIVALADGEWRDGARNFDRALLMFGDAGIDAARTCWRTLGADAMVERYYWSQDESGRWREGPRHRQESDGEQP